MNEEKKGKYKWVDAVARMIELTQQGEMRWKSVEPTGTATAEKNRTSGVFQTTLNGKPIRLYERKVQQRRSVLDDDDDYNPLSKAVATAMLPLIPKYTFVWVPDVILEFVDAKGTTLWTFPQVSALRDLLTAVQYQVAGVSEFLEDLFSETTQLEVSK